MAEVIKAPRWFPRTHGVPVFLAGSIEMGAAEDWQAEVTSALMDTDALILNPRRDGWDSSWEQSIDNPEFREQVEWELNGIQNVDYIAISAIIASMAKFSSLFSAMAEVAVLFTCAVITNITPTTAKRDVRTTAKIRTEPTLFRDW